MLTLVDAINSIKSIDTIIFSGVAFGNYVKKNEGKQHIGDILVSKQLWNYETGRIDDSYTPRGDKLHATSWLIDRFQNSSLYWNKSKVHYGVIASGEKLIDSSEFIDQILTIEPEVIGGEMEGVGLVSVAERYRKDWIVVKGICDWGCEKCDDHQESVAKLTFFIHNY